VPGASSMCC
ncbi:hypothetical protein TGP89_420990, partial [Toxoplasma gondii p89]